MEPLIGQIQAFGFPFAPRGWALCEGQILSISQHQALFSLLGTIYGGDGRTTFMLPDLRGRVPIGKGQGPGLPSYLFGQRGNTPTTLTDGGDGELTRNGSPYLAINWCIAIQGIFPSRS